MPSHAAIPRGSLACDTGVFSPHIEHNRTFSKETRHLAEKSEVGFRAARIRTAGQVSMTNTPVSDARAAPTACLGTGGHAAGVSPVSTNGRIGDRWAQHPLQAHDEIIAATQLPKNLQLQDFRRTA